MLCMIVAGITIVPQNVQAATASGNDGEIHWEIKGDTLTLSAVKGTKGRMKNYGDYWDKEKQQWISKMDVGTKSNTEQEKGEASDSFKRACFSHGIGRELYTAPFIWIGAEKVSIKRKNDRYTTYDKFKISSISYNENREITGLSIINQDGRVVYSLIDRSLGQQGLPELQKEQKEHTHPADEHAEAINKELARTGVALDTVLQRYGVKSVQEMDDNTYKKAMNSLKRTKAKAA